jgi:tRNA 2-thiouridine synthesizing protein E
METFVFKGKNYQVDSEGFLADFRQWDPDYAEGMALKVQTPGGLKEEHWGVINFIRGFFEQSGKCPLVYQTCRMNNLNLRELKRLFPAGYLRGACKLSGITYRECYVKYSWVEADTKKTEAPGEEKFYEIDALGFLVDPRTWDEQFAIYKAEEMKMPEKLSERHWQVIRFLRARYKKDGVVPAIYETCEANNMDIDELEKLFPDGYHRGAVKIAGLRVR